MLILNTRTFYRLSLLNQRDPFFFWFPLLCVCSAYQPHSFFLYNPACTPCIHGVLQRNAFNESSASNNSLNFAHPTFIFTSDNDDLITFITFRWSSIPLLQELTHDFHEFSVRNSRVTGQIDRV